MIFKPDKKNNLVIKKPLILLFCDGIKKNETLSVLIDQDHISVGIFQVNMFRTGSVFIGFLL
ncbi:hypothetical protein SAMN05421785_1099 [Chryseobacterium gambrini]|uniref:Uncharacterized protein n=1 Tax=Chryseobacterium gambrini TaxID=373672 RepID=A0A1N7Q3W7_9FLAO|nr:hypothetical protein SAMN05421785_1099 [Chryseobacterium gambrini]